MAALTASRNTQQHKGDGLFAHPAKANAVGFAGGLAALDATGHLVSASTSTTLKAAGRIRRSFNNTGGANGAIMVEVEQGVFKFANSSAGDLIAQVDVGTDCYIVDDQTVAKTNGTNTRSVAGKVVAVESDGVFVRVALF